MFKMEASVKVDHNMKSEDDLDDLGSVKLHERFIGNYEQEDDTFSDSDNFEQDTDSFSVPCQAGSFSVTNKGFPHPVRSLEMDVKSSLVLDAVRNSCHKSGIDLLSLNRDEDSLCNGSLLSSSFLGSGPPYGDPLREMDLLQSALTLLDDKKCQKFREEGLFDGLIDDDARTMKGNGNTEEKYRYYNGEKLDVADFDQKIPMPPQNIYDFDKSEESSEDAHSNKVQQLLNESTVERKSQQRPTTSRSSRSKKSNNKHVSCSSNSSSRCSVDLMCTSSNLDDIVRFITGETVKKNRKKGDTVSSTRKCKKPQNKKSDLSSRTKTNPTDKTIVNSEKDDDEKINCCGRNNERNSGKEAVAVVYDVTNALLTPGLKNMFENDDFLNDNLDDDNDNLELGDFTAVLHKRRSRAKKENSHGNDFPYSNDSLLPTIQKKGTVTGLHLPVATCKAENLHTTMTSVLNGNTSSSLKFVTAEASSKKTQSTRGSLSSLDEAPPAEYEMPTLSIISNSQSQSSILPSASTVGSSSTGGSSYAAILLCNLPAKTATKLETIKVHPGCEIIPSETGSSSEEISDARLEHSSHEIVLAESDAGSSFEPSSQTEGDNSGHKIVPADACSSSSEPSSQAELDNSGHEIVCAESDTGSLSETSMQTIFSSFSSLNPSGNIEALASDSDVEMQVVMSSESGDIKCEGKTLQDEIVSKNKNVSCSMMSSDIMDLQFLPNFTPSEAPEGATLTEEVNPDASSTCFKFCRQQSESPVFFDTRKHRVSCGPYSDFVFGFDPDEASQKFDSFANGALASDAVTGNLEEVKVFGSEDHSPLEIPSSEMFNKCNQSVSFAGRTSLDNVVNCMPMEDDVLAHTPLMIDSDVTAPLEEEQCTGISTEYGECIENFELIKSLSLSSQSPNEVETIAKVGLLDNDQLPGLKCSGPGQFAKTLVKNNKEETHKFTSFLPCFDLTGAQKFLNRAFRHVLNLESEWPSKVIRLKTTVE